jgi:hypothetical protein
MNGRLLGRLLLSLTLLWSQQAAFSHTLSHLVQASSTAGGAPGKSSTSRLKDLSCADCFTHAQFFSALGSAHRSLETDKPAPLRAVVPATPENCIMTVCMFQSRAPPSS